MRKYQKPHTLVMNVHPNFMICGSINVKGTLGSMSQKNMDWGGSSAKSTGGTHVAW